jgi:hypothetical protein
VSNDEVVLEAYVDNSKGVLDRGLYQVDVRDGSYLKVVDIPDEAPTTYKFCFDGDVLHVMTKRGDYELVTKPKGYKVFMREMDEESRGNRYSPLRCQIVDPPFQSHGFKALRKGDGYLKYHTDQNDERQVYIADEAGNNLRKLVQQHSVRKGSPVGLFTVKYFLENENAYFGYSPWNNKNCTELWWLHREDWRVEQDQLCLGKRSFGSRVVHRLNDALYLEHHTDHKGEAKTFVIFQDNELEIEKEKVRGSSVSPDGCKVSYGVDVKNAPMRQKLKLFNYCEFQQQGNKLK